jgi:hypothetical protein
MVSAEPVVPEYGLLLLILLQLEPPSALSCHWYAVEVASEVALIVLETEPQYTSGELMLVLGLLLIDTVTPGDTAP